MWNPVSSLIQSCLDSEHTYRFILDSPNAWRSLEQALVEPCQRILVALVRIGKHVLPFLVTIFDSVIFHGDLLKNNTQRGFCNVMT